MTVRRTVVKRLAAPGISAARTVYTGCPIDIVRVAALVEIAAAAASLARTVVKLRHLDPATIAAYVADPTDARAVLGRGRWLPSMTRHVPEPPATSLSTNLRAVSGSVRRRARRASNSTQIALFPSTTTAKGR
ncbi:hypothetical protein WEI85_34930 [Actinomycetes bacterium KLBMP 9797]